MLTLISSCSVEEEDPLNVETQPAQEILGEERFYKGIFATTNSSFRGTVDLTLPAPKDEAKGATAKATLKLHSGEVIEVRSTSLKESNKSSGFNLDFDSADLSFTFILDEAGTPLVTNVVYKEQESAIIVAEETDKSQVTPLTGVYKCTNCENQDTYEGIDLNNEERVFNLLLSSTDGSTSVSIQAALGSLIEAGFAVEENCSTAGRYTSCQLLDSDTNELFTWSAVHRYAMEADEKGETCSGISGNITFNTSDMGVILAEFETDGACPVTTFYVSPSGNDANSGASPQEAWKTIEKVNSVNLKPGDNVLFEGNNSYEGSIYLDSNDANDSSNPVIISSYGTGKGTIKSGLKDGFFAYNTAGLKIDNLIFSGTATTDNENSGIRFYNDLPGNTKLELVEVTNCEVFGYRDSGIVIGAWNGNSGFKDVLIENNKVHDILDAGISSFGYFSQTKTGYAHSNIVVRNCEVYDIPGYNKGNNSGNGIVLSDVQNSVIEYCTAYNSGHGNTYKGGGPVGIWYWDADQVIIQYNEVYGMASASNKDGGGFDLDGGVTNGIMQYNYSHDNEGAGYLIGQFTWARPMRNITVRYNISQNDAATNGGSVYLFNGETVDSMKDIYVYNNTLYLSEQASNSGSATIKYGVWKTIRENINFYNNILVAENGADFIDVPGSYNGNFKGNLYYSSGSSAIKFQGQIYSNLETFRSTGNEIHENTPVGYEGDPVLTDAGRGGIIGFGNRLSDLTAYKLQAGSPAIDAGISFDLATGNRDFYGNDLSLDAIPDIGAHGNLSENKSGELAGK